MKGSRYLVRFDDICPTMDWLIWEKVEALLLKYDVKPILAVVPDNRDPKLMVMPPELDFWSRVRYWQSLGWTIALHGYQHCYETSSKGLVGINPFSEFAGLSYQDQRQKLTTALEIFSQYGVEVDAWVAPAHSFDEITVELLVDFNIRVISDGYYWRVIQRMGAIWVPQQMWRFRRIPIGVWSVCYHHNNFSIDDLARLEFDFRRFSSRIVGLPYILNEQVPRLETCMDRLFHWSWTKAVEIKRRYK